MNKDKYTKSDRLAGFAGVLILVCGIIMLFQGYSAYRSGTIIPATGKHGPMSGPEFMVAGGMSSVFGLGLLLNELVKAYRRKKNNY